MLKLAFIKVLFFIAAILLPCFCVTAQTVSIPDPYFEQALIVLNIDSDGVVNGQVLASDVENVIELLLNNNNGLEITSLTGLEAFENIETLQVVFTQIATLDVSHNLRLKTLICNNNFLTDINVSSNILLENLTIGNFGDLFPQNEITQLDLSQNPNIKFLSIANLSWLLNRINLKNGNNNFEMEIEMDFEFPSPDNTNVVCIEVDNKELALSNQAPYSEWIIYTGPYALYRYSENCALSTPKSQVYRDIYVHPNPASNILHIGNRLANATANVMLYDMSGRVVLEQNIKNDDSIDISGLGKGVYMVVIDDGAVRSSHKVIVE